MQSKVIALSLKEICQAIKHDLKLRHLTHASAAEKIGCQKQTLSNILVGKYPISKEMAKKMADGLGYSPEFIIYGVGELYAPGHQVWVAKDNEYFALGRKNDPVLQQSKVSQVAATIIRILNNKVAIKCFDSYCKGNIEEYKETLEILKHDFYGDMSLAGTNERQRILLLNMRDYFTELELQSSKELIEIEKKCAKGKKDPIDEEVKRFRNKLKALYEMYKNESVDDSDNKE